MLAFDRDTNEIEHANHAKGRAGPDQRIALGQAANVVRMKPIHIFARINALDDFRLSNVVWQRQLHEDPVDVGVGIQRINAREQLDLAGRMRQIERARINAAFLAGRSFVAHVHLRGRIIPNHNDREARRSTPTRAQSINPRAHLGFDLVRNRSPIDQAGPV